MEEEELPIEYEVKFTVTVDGKEFETNTVILDGFKFEELDAKVVALFLGYGLKFN